MEKFSTLSALQEMKTKEVMINCLEERLKILNTNNDWDGG